MSALLTVSGAVGGIGTSTFAFAVALQAGAGALLIDAQPDGVPLDVLVGAEDCAGTRWSQVRVRTSEIAADSIRAALPQYRGLYILSSDAESTADLSAIPHLISAMRQGGTSVVLDLSARDELRQRLNSDVDVLLLPATLPGIVAARATLLDHTRLVLIDTGAADVKPLLVSEYLEREIVAVVRWQRAVAAAATAGAPPPTSCDVMRAAAQVWAGVADVA